MKQRARHHLKRKISSRMRQFYASSGGIDLAIVVNSISLGAEIRRGRTDLGVVHNVSAANTEGY